ncbi:MAG: hypothetical protein ACM3O8_07225 [Methylococcaceae bacterium]
MLEELEMLKGLMVEWLSCINNAISFAVDFSQRKNVERVGNVAVVKNVKRVNGSMAIMHQQRNILCR